MKKLLLSLVSFGFASTAAAIPVYTDFGLEAGVRQQSGASASATQTASSQMGYQIGFVGFFPVHENMGIRTGLMYVNRPLSISNDSTVATGDAKINLNSFDIPLAFAYKFEDYASVFGGVALSANLEGTYSGSGALAGGKLNDVKSFLVPIVIGASIKFAPQLGGSVFFETIGGSLAREVKDYKAVGLNLVVTFD